MVDAKGIFLKRRGVDFIKVQSGVPHDAYLAIAQESRRLGIAFEGHVPDAVGAADAEQSTSGARAVRRGRVHAARGVADRDAQSGEVLWKVE